VLAVLCVTQIVSWGVLYYAFPVLALSIADETGWSVATITAGVTARGSARSHSVDRQRHRRSLAGFGCGVTSASAGLLC
jgi:hypothetical protein